jgi:hypothetical protein
MCANARRNALIKALDLPNRPRTIWMRYNFLTDERDKVIRNRSGAPFVGSSYILWWMCH